MSKTDQGVSRAFAIAGVILAVVAIAVSVATTWNRSNDFGVALVLGAVTFACWIAGLGMSIAGAVSSRGRRWLAWAGIAISLVLPCAVVVVLIQAMA